MAELSMETQAIIDKLKSEGELMRNRGSNSIRSVKIQLDRFEGVFNTISTNITEQTNILRMQADIAQEQLEEQRNRTQLEEIEPPERTEDPTPPRSDTESQQSREETDEKINKMGDAIANALSLKNIATAGIGLFLGYNFLKGFIDQATGGGFSRFENNVGEFADSLPETISSLTAFSTDLPASIRETQESIKESFNELSKGIQDTKESIDNLVTKISSTIDTFTDLGSIAAAFISATTIVGATGAVANLRAEQLKKQRLEAEARNARTRPSTPETTAPAQRNFTIDENGNPLDRRGNPLRGAARDLALRTAEADAAVASSGGGRGSVVEAPGERAAATSRSGQAVRNLTDVENTISNPTMRKVYVKLLKGLGVLGIGLTLYQAGQIAALLNDPQASEDEKVTAVGAFVGELVGGVSLAVGVGVLTATFGPWAMLISGLIAGVAGTFAGGWLGEYIARWAFDTSPTNEDIQTARRLQGIDTYYEVQPRPTTGGRSGIEAKRRWDSLYGETHNADGTPKNISQANPASTNPQRSIENSQGGSAIEDVTPMSVDPQSSTLESIQRSNNLSLASQSELLGSAGITTGDTSVVYSPVINAPASYNIGGDNVAVASFNDRRSGGGGRLQYGITGAVS